MKKLLPPLGLLLTLFLLAGANGLLLSRFTARWQDQLLQAESWAIQEQWDRAANVLEESYRDWQRAQGYLHVVLAHGAVDGAEAMYHRARAFALAQEPAEFRAETAGLRTQLALLAEMEQFSLKNVL